MTHRTEDDNSFQLHSIGSRETLLRRPARHRSTRQSAAVREALARRPGFTSAQDLHAELRGSGAAVGLTTVYRHLQALADAGAVDVLRDPDGEAVYRICGTGQHHHLACRDCGWTVEISGGVVERPSR